MIRVRLLGRLAGALALVIALTGMEGPQAQTQPVWRLAAAMSVPRSGHFAIRLMDGRVLVAGGHTGSLYLSSAEIFDPRTNTWMPVPSMSTPRFSPTATLMADGRVLVAGGYDGSTATSSTELFDPGSESWVPGPAMRVARHTHLATQLPDGRLLVTGGYTHGSEYAAYTATTEIYDSGRQEWRLLASMRAARVFHTAAVLPDGRVLVAGGANYGQYEAITDIFYPPSNTWTAGPDFCCTPRYAHTGTVLPDGRAIVAGGFYAGGYLSSAEIYHPGGNSWTDAPGLSNPRRGATGVTLPDGRWMVVGGEQGTAVGTVDLFDPEQGQWANAGDLNEWRAFPTATALDDGRVLVTGGRGGADAAARASVEVWGVPAAPKLMVDAVSGRYAGALDLSATLASGQGPVPGRLVTFMMNGVDRGQALTDASGRARLRDVPLGAILPGVYADAVLARWDGDAFAGSATGIGTLTVEAAPSEISWPTPASIAHGTPLSVSQLNASSPVAGTFNYSPAAGTVLAAGVHTLHVTFLPSDPGYQQAEAAVTLVVAKAVPPIVWPRPDTIVYGTALGSMQFNATSPVAGTFTYFPPAGSVPGGGNVTLTAFFTPLAGGNYTATSASHIVAVDRAATTLAIRGPAAIAAGEPAVWTVSLTLPALGSANGVTVQLMDGQTVLAAPTLSGGNGIFEATVAKTFLTTAGSPRDIWARFTGNLSLKPSDSDHISLTVTPQEFNYALKELGTLGGTESYPTAINSSGHVAGYASTAAGQPHAFLHRGSGMQDLGTLGGTSSMAFAINDDGVVTGTASIAGNQGTHAFRWKDGTMTDLGTLGGRSSQANGINAAGDIVGYSEVVVGSSVRHAFLYRNGTMIDLGTLGGTNSEAIGIDDAGRVVVNSDTPGNQFFQRRTFVWENGVQKDLGTLGGTLTTARAVNAAGAIVGETTMTGGLTRSFLYVNGTMTDLGPIFESVRPFGSNGHGEIVGMNQWTSLSEEHATLRRAGRIVDLNAATSGMPPWRYLSRATAINDAGQIVGYGPRTDISSNLNQAFLLSVQKVSTLDLIDSTSTYGSAATLRATLTTTTGPIDGRTVTFAVNGTTVGFATTAGGIAELEVPPSLSRNAGTYAVTATFAGDLSFTASADTATLHLMQGVPVLTFGGDGSFVFDGQPHAVTASATGTFGEALGAVPVTYTTGGPPINSGTHTATGTYAGNVNYAAASGGVKVIIVPAPPAISVGMSDVTYDGAPHAAVPSATGVSGASLTPLVVSYRLYRPDGKDQQAQQPQGTPAPVEGAPTDGGGSAAGPALDDSWFSYPPVDAGDYEVDVWYGGSVNYRAGSARGRFVIRRAVPTVTVSGGTSVYDGRPHTASAFATGISGEDLGSLTVQYDAGSEAPVNAGTYLASSSFAGSANYEPATGSAPMVITPALPTITLTGGDVVYDGHPHPATAAATGVLGEQLPSPAIEYPGGEAPIDAGVFLVTARVPASQNYTAASRSTEIIIRRAAPVISVNGGTFGYDGRPHAATASATGVFGESLGAVAVLYNGASAVPSDAGVYAVSATFPGNANYTAGSGSGTLRIEPGAPTIAVTSGVFDYDGRPHPVAGTVTGNEGQPLGTLTFTYNGSTAVPVNAGTYQVVGHFQGAGNYSSGTATAVVSIVKVPLTVSVASAGKVYGQPNPVFAAVYTGFVGDDSPASLGGALTFETLATDASPTGVYVVAPRGLTSLNYVLDLTPGALTITQANAAVLLGSSSNPSGYLQPVALRAEVRPSPSGAGAATGTVEFLDGTIVIGSATVTDGAATINLVLEPGSHPITARYLGDANVAANTATLVQTVNPRSESSSTTVRMRPSTSTLGERVTFDVDVSASGGSAAGKVELWDSDAGTVLDTLTLTNSKATYSTTALSAGAHTIVARYLPDASVITPPSVSSPVVHTVLAGAPLERTTIKLSAKQATALAPTEVEVTVAAQGGTPTGSVRLWVDGGAVIQAPLVPSSARESKAILPIGTLPEGVHLLTAVYMGSDTHTGSSGEIELRVKK